MNTINLTPEQFAQYEAILNEYDRFRTLSRERRWLQIHVTGCFAPELAGNGLRRENTACNFHVAGHL